MQNGTETNLQHDILADLLNETETFLQENIKMETLVISKMTTTNSGQYICIANHLNNTLVKKVDVTVICKYIEQLYISCSILLFLLTRELNLLTLFRAENNLK